MTIGPRELTLGAAGADPEFRATYSVYRDRVVARGPEDTVRARFSYGPDGWLARPGEVWTYRWSLYRDRLTLHALPGEISPEPFRAVPWRKVG
jgi:hypothetical protein